MPSKYILVGFLLVALTATAFTEDEGSTVTSEPEPGPNASTESTSELEPGPTESTESTSAPEPGENESKESTSEPTTSTAEPGQTTSCETSTTRPKKPSKRPCRDGLSILFCRVGINRQCSCRKNNN